LNYIFNQYCKKKFSFVSDQDLLSAAAWYQEGLPQCICEEYLNNNDKPIGSFIIRCSYNPLDYPFILSIKINQTSTEHFSIQRTINNNAYRIKVCLIIIPFFD
jgi:hypothetical protein